MKLAILFWNVLSLKNQQMEVLNIKKQMFS